LIQVMALRSGEGDMLLEVSALRRAAIGELEVIFQQNMSDARILVELEAELNRRSTPRGSCVATFVNSLRRVAVRQMFACRRQSRGIGEGAYYFPLQA
jgi:hypothetical protein